MPVYVKEKPDTQEHIAKLRDWAKDPDIERRFELFQTILQLESSEHEYANRGYTAFTEHFKQNLQDGAPKVGAVVLSTGATLHVGLRQLLPAWWKTRAAVTGLGLLGALGAGMFHVTCQGMLEGVQQQDSVMADIVCPDVLSNPCRAVDSPEWMLIAQPAYPVRLYGACKEQQLRRAQQNLEGTHTQPKRFWSNGFGLFSKRQS